MVGSRTIAIEDGKLRSYEGGWADYARIREERRSAESEAKAAGKRAESQQRKAAKEPSASKPANGNGSGAANGKGLSKNMRRKIGAIEREIERSETALKALEEELADPTAWSTPELSEQSTARHAEAKRAVELAYERWDEVTTATAG